MPSTSVHMPESLLAALDELADEKGLSRNRLIVEACRAEVRKRREWPAGFFDDDRFSAEEIAELRASDTAFVQEITTARRNRSRPPI